MSRIYYRIQPAGLPVAGHRSESSDGAAAGVDVFTTATNVLQPDVKPSAYGDEVVVMRSGGHWDNGDVEGVRIDGATAEIVARLPWGAWVELCDSLGGPGDEMDDAVDAHFGG